jgi:hypothetical protein
MQENTITVKLPDTHNTELPLGYKKIYLTTLPPRHVEDKLVVYNKKYKFSTTQITESGKPISKIVY